MTMKKFFTIAGAALMLSGSASAVTLNISARYGQNLATYAKTPNETEVDDGFFFCDNYFDNKVGAQYTSRGTYDFITFKADGRFAGVEAKLKVMSKDIGMRLYNGWVGTDKFKFYAGRFDAYPLVEIVDDATVGYHFNSYACQYQPGFDPQVMSLFLREEGFVRHVSSRIDSTASDNVNAKVSLDLESNNWYFYDANNAGACIDYDTSYFGNRGGMMVQYSPDYRWLFRFVSTFGSAWTEGSEYTNNYIGERTFTNFNMQANYVNPGLFSVALTFKMSDIISGIYTDGDSALKSAGSDIQGMLAVSSDFFPNLRLYADYLYAAVFLGMEDVFGNSDVLVFHAADVRAVYSVTDRIKVGANGNISSIVQSQYAKSLGYDDGYFGFNFGLSASYRFRENLAFDCTAGVRCVNVNNRNSDDERDWRQVTCLGIEPSVCWTLAKHASVNLGVNFLCQNFSDKDEGKSIWLNNNKNSLASSTVYPGTIVVTVPLYMKVSL